MNRKEAILSGATGSSLVTGMYSVIAAPDAITTIASVMGGPKDVVQTVPGLQYGPGGLEQIGPVTTHAVLQPPTVGVETVAGAISPAVTLALWGFIAWQLGIPQYVVGRTRLFAQEMVSKINRRGQGPDSGTTTRIGFAAKPATAHIERARR